MHGGQDDLLVHLRVLVHIRAWLHRSLLLLLALSQRATPRPVLIDLTSEGEGMAGPAAKRIKREAGSSSSQPPPPAAVVDLTA